MSTSDRDDRIFKALAATTRREILDLLRDSPLTTATLCARFPKLDRCTVMQHLGVLEHAELILVRREGRNRWNHLNPLPIKHIHDRWIGQHAMGAVAMLDRLKNQLESAS